MSTTIAVFAQPGGQRFAHHLFVVYYQDLPVSLHALTPWGCAPQARARRRRRMRHAFDRSAGRWWPATWRRSGPRSAPARTGGRFHGALLCAARSSKNFAIRREAVELLAQPRQGHHGHAATQLRLSEHEGQHRNEQVAIGHRQQLAGILGTARGATFPAPGRSRTAGAPRRRRNPRGRISMLRTGTPNSAASRSVTAVERLGLHLSIAPTYRYFIPCAPIRGGSLCPSAAADGSDTVNVVPSPTCS